MKEEETIDICTYVIELKHMCIYIFGKMARKEVGWLMLLLLLEGWVCVGRR